jgi:predicted lipid-binding transport protein (Tim44 family)
MKAVDPAFSPEAFIAGAESAFRMIVAAFAAGDRVALRPLLSDETYRAFEGAIAAREAAGETQRTEIQSMPGASIESAELRNRHAIITMRFVSDQVNLTTAKDGSIVHGTDAVTEITDLWSFERELGSADPTWRLVAARSA